MASDELSKLFARCDDAIALVDGDDGTAWTYAELDRKGRHFAEVLEASGVRVGDRVVLVAENALGTFALLDACGRLGAALVPINWRLAPREVLSIVERVQPRVVVHDDAFRELGESCAAKLRAGRLRMNGGLEELDSAEARELPQTPEEVALVLFTSGTTGLPKGAMLSWRQLLTNALNTKASCGLTEKDRGYSSLPLFHTGGLNCFATPLLAVGGSCIITKRFEPARAATQMREHGVSCFIGVPFMHQGLLEQPGWSAEGMPSLRSVLSGGAPLPAKVRELAGERGIPLREGYGLTEAGPNLFSMGPLPGEGMPGMVGRPAPHGELRLASDGEIRIRGPHVTLGYLFDDAATKAAFDENGFFCTGDLAVEEGGQFRVVGRSKEMFISGGENVYPAEVESALMSIEGIVEAAVIGVPDDRWGEVGRAYIVGDVALQNDALRKELRAILAPYKVPKEFHRLEELPRNSSGKVQKQLLRGIS